MDMERERDVFDGRESPEWLWLVVVLLHPSRLTLEIEECGDIVIERRSKILCDLLTVCLGRVFTVQQGGFHGEGYRNWEEMKKRLVVSSGMWVAQSLDGSGLT